MVEERRKEQHYWTDKELDLEVIKIVGDEAFERERIRKLMESVTSLPLLTISLAMDRVCVPEAGAFEGKKLFRLNGEALKTFQKLQEVTTKNK